MFIRAYGEQEVWLHSPSDLSRVFFEGDCSVEDELQRKEIIRITFHVLHVFSL